MTPQTGGIVGSLIAIVGAALGARGWFGIDTAGWTTLLGAAVTAAGVAVNVWSTRKSNIVSATADMTEVKQVILDKNAPVDIRQIDALDKATPSNVVVK